MKRLLPLLIVLCAVALLYGLTEVRQVDLEGNSRNPGVLFSIQDDWTAVAPVQGYFDPNYAGTTPGPTLRTEALFNAEPNVVTIIPARWNRVRIRCLGTTDGDTQVFDVFLSQGNANLNRSDHYTRVGTLTWTIGTQTGDVATYEFADTVVISNATNCWGKSWIPMSPTGDYIAEAWLDVAGSSSIGFAGTTLANRCLLQITGF